MSFISIKKKIRGLRSKVKRIEKWKAENIELDIDALMRYKKVYVKLWISPFYNLYNINKNKVGHKNPPNWFNKIILSAMLDVYKRWDEKLKELGVPYYLKIWLYDPDFINSQIVAAIDYDIDYYETLFEREDRKIKFPSNKYKLADKKILDFDWECCKDQYVVFQSEYIDDQAYLEYLKKVSYRIQEERILGQNKICYYVKEGNVWVGTLKN